MDCFVLSLPHHYASCAGAKKLAVEKVRFYEFLAPLLPYALQRFVETVVQQRDALDVLCRLP